MSTQLYRAGSAAPIAEVQGFLDGVVNDRARFSTSQVVDTSTWQRLRPPPGRKYHPDLARFAADGRFLPESPTMDEYILIDMLTEKTLELPPSADLGNYQPGLGWFLGGPQASLRLPPPEHLTIVPDLLELWVQVAVRGQLDEEGNFVKWDEPTWENKRQELAAKPAPYPDFPFPGHVAADRLHWLRQEYENAKASDQAALARQLLDRAEAMGDLAEASRWRRVLTPKPNNPDK